MDGLADQKLDIEQKEESGTESDKFKLKLLASFICVPIQQLFSLIFGAWEGGSLKGLHSQVRLS